MVIFDTSVIVGTLDPNAMPPIDPQTNAPLTNFKARVEFLIKQLDGARETILIPTPVLSEFLVRAGPNKYQYIDKFIAARNFMIGSFDQRAAIDLSLLNDPDLNALKKLDDKTTWAKVKYDRQIVAIAKSQGANCIYTGDKPLAECARSNGIKAVMTWELPEPPEDKQMSLLPVNT